MLSSRVFLGYIGVDWYVIGKRNDEEGAKEKLYTYASHVIVESFKVRRGTPIACHYWLNRVPTGSRDTSR